MNGSATSFTNLGDCLRLPARADNEALVALNEHGEALERLTARGLDARLSAVAFRGLQAGLYPGERA
ncbi:MAG: hypothetical protein RLN59_01215, partial [Haliea sp.]